jgi:hypothetical protein
VKTKNKKMNEIFNSNTSTIYKLCDFTTSKEHVGDKQACWQDILQAKSTFETNKLVECDCSLIETNACVAAVAPLVVGCVLGDAFVNKYGALIVEHSVSQEEYVHWKFEQFQKLGVLTLQCTPKLVSRVHPRTKKEHKSLRFNTRSLFKLERALFYPQGSKLIPANFELLCSPQSMAVWFMDDGGRGGNTPSGIVLDVSSFSMPDVQRVTQCLQKRWGILTSIHHHSKKSKKIYFKKETVNLFCDLIRPFIIESMRYKLVS